jgi:hypothetical protein
MTGLIAACKTNRHPGRAAARSGAAQIRDLSPQIPCLQRTAAALRCARDDGNDAACKTNRHPGRAAARSGAAQIRDLSPPQGLCAKPHQIPCLQRTAAALRTR